MENKPASLLDVPLGKSLNGIPPSWCGRQVAGNSKAEMGIYRDNLSAIIFYRLPSSLKIVWIYRFPISLL